MSYSHKTSFNVGDLVPVYCQEIYPGDTFKCDANIVCRVTSSFIKPVMDNLFADMMFFFVPSRTVFNRWAEIFGENNESAWARETVVSAPTMPNNSTSTTINSHSIASYLCGFPGLNAQNFSVKGGINLLPFRAYAKIYNEWYRDENLIDPMNIQMGAANSSERYNNDDFGPDNYTGNVAKVAKLHDYFTQLVPSPQKGDPVEIGVASLPSMSVPVVTGTSRSVGSFPVLHFSQAGGASVPSAGTLGYTATGNLGTVSEGTAPSLTTPSLYPDNLHANIPETPLASVSVNDLRLAFQTQKILERDAIFGTRYTEYLKGHFGVTSSDARLQRSEFLGGRRFPLSVLQTTQTSQSTTNSPLANVAGWSLTNGRAGYTKGFTEHGYVIGMLCVRQFHTYQQGIEKFWWRKDRSDYMDPLYQNIGYQPVYEKEIYAFGSAGASEVFGYAPAFEDCRCRQNRISGQLHTNDPSNLDIWHFGDAYATKPILGQEFIEETPKFVDRTITVPSTTVDNFICDVYFKQYGIRTLSTFGMPGLIDHH